MVFLFFPHVIINDNQTNLLQAAAPRLNVLFDRSCLLCPPSCIHGQFCSLGVYFLTVVLSKTTILVNKFIKIRPVTD
jgi:hypothetical protein